MSASKLIQITLRIGLMLMISLSVGGCAYSGQFTCSDAKGVRCLMLSEIDKRVDSGEIETVYGGKKCKGCSFGAEGNVPKLRGKVIKARLIKPEDASKDENVDRSIDENTGGSEEGEYLYVR